VMLLALLTTVAVSRGLARVARASDGG
jgi:hypothetical protein